MNLKEFYLKHERIFLILLVIIIFSAVYFPINYLTSFRQTYQLHIFIDSLIPFLPLTIFIYHFTYIIWFIPYFFIKKIKPLRKLTWAYLIMIFISAFIFLIFPVKMIRPEITGGGLLNWLIITYYSMDLPYNTFPSIHASYTLLAGLFTFKHNKKIGLILLILAFLIILATLTFKQHYFLDAVVGIILSITTYLILFRK